MPPRLLFLVAALAAGALGQQQLEGGVLPGARAVGPGGGLVSVPRTGTGRKRPHHYAFFTEKAPCAVLERRYVPSPLEARWANASAAWKAAGNGELADFRPYCDLLVETRPAIDRMLSLINQTMGGKGAVSDAADADEVLSAFHITLQCGPYTLTLKEHIESLVAALRHPYAVQCGPDYASRLPTTDLFDKGYVLLGAWAGQQQGARNKFYLDAGAGVGYRENSNQFWMVEMYGARGITFDRLIYWEEKSASGATPFAGVPQELFPALTFYNMPASSAPNDGRNPLVAVTRIARPEDFVSVKLDIDAPSIEGGWLSSILGRSPEPGAAPRPGGGSRFSDLIDELFWEHHFRLAPLMKCCWGGTVDKDSVLADSIATFQELRRLGIRAHYWQ